MPSGCRLWQGARKSGSTHYGMIKAKFPDTQWRTLHVHRLRYLVHVEQLKLPHGLEVSHLCHEPLCVAPEHLTLESHSVNGQRQACAARSKCCGHDNVPNCIF